MMATHGASSTAAARFAGRRVVVTGGARGIGAAIAGRFVAEGATVAVLDRLAADAERTAAGIGGIAVGVDLGDPTAAASAVDRAVGQLGGIDVLVNNAGIFRVAPLLAISCDEWDEMFAVNVRAMLVTIQVAGRAMIDQGTGGKMVNMASMGGKVAAAGQAHYAASKAAVISLTQAAAVELGPFGINVNAICPGYVLTEMGAATRTPEMVAEWSAKSPLGRVAEPHEVAAMATFLASSDADYCTGQAFNVTGGMIMH